MCRSQEWFIVKKNVECEWFGGLIHARNFSTRARFRLAGYDFIFLDISRSAKTKGLEHDSSPILSDYDS